jgi:putative thioredoxin
MTQQPPLGGIQAQGAVDLAALAQARQVQQQAEQAKAGLVARAEAGGGAESTAVVEVTEANFETEVVARSMTVPVVLDFWAGWCAPCKQLTPILERLVAADGGAWVLGTVDVDANPQLAAAAQAQSIPTVLVAWQGQFAPGFTGALPEAQVRLFIDEVLAIAGTTPAVAEAVDEAQMTQADEAMMAGDLDAAQAAYEAAIAERPGDAEAAAGLVQVVLLRRTQGVDAAAARQQAASGPSDVSAQILVADLDLLDGDIAAALNRLIDTVVATEGDDRERARVHLLELFELVGNADPAVLAARTRLASALF